MFYIPTRYSNGLAGELAPAEFYEEEDAIGLKYLVNHYIRRNFFRLRIAKPFQVVPVVSR